MEQDNNQKFIIVAALSFIVGFGLAWLIVSNKECKEDEVSKEGDKEIAGELTENGLSGLANTTNFLTVPDQEEGVEVIINNVVLDEASWVVIHEENDDGKPERILGAQLFDAGTWSGKVELLRGTLNGKEYIAMIHADNGDRAFDPKKDLPTTDSNGNIKQVAFKVGFVVPTVEIDEGIVGTEE